MRNQRGFTLIELIVAVGLLVLVVLGMATTTVRLVRLVAESDWRATAIELAEDRVQLIAMDPDYEQLEAKYAGTESGFPTLDGVTRETVIVHVGGLRQTEDFKRITVTVRVPGLEDPVMRSLTLAAP